ncbi:hypothetical protein OF83DRAFT_1145511 [Amylostereum chailletii]|nr:hypothetical protein OF83DRAFT_1145511 [Amylostereum chailletii]
MAGIRPTPPGSCKSTPDARPSPARPHGSSASSADVGSKTVGVFERSFDGAIPVSNSSTPALAYSTSSSFPGTVPPKLDSSPNVGCFPTAPSSSLPAAPACSTPPAVLPFPNLNNLAQVVLFLPWCLAMGASICLCPTLLPTLLPTHALPQPSLSPSPSCDFLSQSASSDSCLASLLNDPLRPSFSSDSLHPSLSPSCASLRPSPSCDSFPLSPSPSRDCLQSSPSNTSSFNAYHSARDPSSPEPLCNITAPAPTPTLTHAPLHRLAYYAHTAVPHIALFLFSLVALAWYIPRAGAAVGAVVCGEEVEFVRRYVRAESW